MVYLPKQWILKNPDLDLIGEISNKFNISRITASVLINRGIKSVEEVYIFFNPELFKLQEPFLLPDMNKAVKRIRKAIDNNERILIYGDRDVDGITAVSIVHYTLRSLGNSPLYFIPSQEGYGLHKSIIDEYADKIDLIITVDCGITGTDEVKYAKQKGIDVIVTDHHEIPYNFDGIPDAIAVINPKRQDCNYKFREYAGCTVAFKLMQGVMLSYEENYNNEDILHGNGQMKQIWSRRMEFFLKDHLDLITIGTIGDMMPLAFENRTLVKHGLKLLRSSRKSGIKLLIEQLFRYNNIITTKDISFNIVPVLNACGRLEQSEIAVELLTTDNFIYAEKMLDKMLQINETRRLLQDTHMGVVKQLVNEQCNIETDKILFIIAEKIEQGVAGIIATRLVHQYNRPVILLNIDGDKTVGTCRTIGKFNIYDVIENCNDILIKYGGHQQAAGFTLRTEHVGQLHKRINEIIEQRLSLESLIPEIEIDTELEASEVSIGLIDELMELEPYGQSNPYPVFMLKNVKIEQYSRMGRGSKNIRLKIRLNNNNYFDAIGLGMGYQYGNVRSGYDNGFIKIPRYAELAVQLQTVRRQDRNHIQFLVLDLRPSM